MPELLEQEALLSFAPLLLLIILVLLTGVLVAQILGSRQRRHTAREAADGQRQLLDGLKELHQHRDSIERQFHQLDQDIHQFNEHLIERLANNNLRQQGSLSDFQQVVTERFSMLQQGLEKRFGDTALAQRDASEKFSRELLGQFELLQKHVVESLADGQLVQQRVLSEFREQLQSSLGETRQQMASQHHENQQRLQDNFKAGIKDVREELAVALKGNSETLQKSMEGLTRATDERLKDISGQVEKRLADGFEKTTQTFNDVLKRLALIDDAQKKITELSTNVVSLQEILADKRSRGAFGEVQLSQLVRNVLPEQNFALQYTLTNGKIVDCALFLPEPTGTIAIDAKFPLENYRRLTDTTVSELERKQAGRQFQQDVKKHIRDIAEKYIIAEETSAGAVMFIPAEAVFAEIHAHFPDLVEEAQRLRVWLVSPTTLMAILTTASSVIRDEATRRQVHIIQEHLGKLGQDFGRFRERMNKLAKHIDSVHKDVRDVNISATKISSRFEKIENVELDEDDKPKSLDLKP